MSISIPKHIRKYWINIALILLSWFMFISSLWQMEIVDIAAWNHQEYVDLPFYIARLHIWFYRDLLYLSLVISMILEFVALWYWD